MYWYGIFTGAFFMFIAAAILIIVIMVRFGNLLQRERAEKIKEARPVKVIIEDCHGNRSIAYEAETIDMRGGEAAAP
jgi:NADH:ubiquinone oxidoreductase subunit 3 (subunit A)